MTEPTPPPESSMPEATRARVRGELLAYAHENRANAPRWAVPLGAAAAVALVAGMAYWAVSGTGGGDDRGSTPVLAESTSSSPAVTPDASAPAPVTESVPASAPPETTMVGTDTCEAEMAQVLKGATLALQFDAATSFWVKGDRFVQCDLLAGRTTVHQPLPLTPDLDDRATYAVSTVFEGARTQMRSAGGVVPAGAEEFFDVTYTFDDGHTQAATTVTDAAGRTWWHLAYSYSYAGNELEQPPITVTVSLSGRQDTYELRPALDTCAQANHGC